VHPPSPPSTGDVLLVRNPVRNLPIDHPQHPEKKQRMRLKKPVRCWEVCGKLEEGGVVSDVTMVTGTSTLFVLVSFVFIS